MNATWLGRCVRSGSVRCFVAIVAALVAATDVLPAGRVAVTDDGSAVAGRLSSDFAETDRQRAARERIEEALASPMDFQFQRVTLSDALEVIADKFDIATVLDRRAIEYNEIGGEAPVEIHVRGISLESGLMLMLEEYDLCLTVWHEVLLVTTPAGAEEKRTAKIYPVADLVRRIDGLVPLVASAEADYEELIDLIKWTVSPTTWDDVGGPGSIEASESTGALAVSQMWSVHREIELFLASMRRVRKRQPLPDIAGQSGDIDPSDELGDDAIVLKLYPLALPTPHLAATGDCEEESDPTTAPAADPRATADELAELIVATVEPESWQAAGGTGRIHAVPGAIVIRNTGAVARTVYEMLDALDALAKPTYGDFCGGYHSYEEFRRAREASNRE